MNGRKRGKKLRRRIREQQNRELNAYAERMYQWYLRTGEFDEVIPS